MQVTEVENNGLKKTLRIVIEATQVNTQMEVQLRAAGERVKIPGFRPGYIPMKVLQQRYGKSVQEEVFREAITRSTNEVLAQRKLRPTTTPDIRVEEYREGGDLAFTVSFESFPPIPEIAFNKITLDRKLFDVGEEDIDKAIKNLAERNPDLKRADEGTITKKGHVVVIDFRGMADGVLFDGGTADDFRLELGSGQFIDGFEDQLEGLKEGDKTTVNVTFPANYPTKSLAAQEASFAVRINEIHTKEMPVVDDAFARQRGLADARALHEAVRSQLIREYDQTVRNQMKKQLFDLLEEQYDFELPPGMVEMEFNAIWQRLKDAQSQGDPSAAGKKDEEMQEEYQKIARRRVKLGLMLAEVGTLNDIQITREELSRAVMRQAGMFPGQEKKVLEFYRGNPERVDDLRGPILEEKAVDHILSKVKFNDHKVSLADLAGGEEDEETEEKAKKQVKAKTSSAKTSTADEPKKAPSAPKAKAAPKKKTSGTKK